MLKPSAYSEMPAAPVAPVQALPAQPFMERAPQYIMPQAVEPSETHAFMSPLQMFFLSLAAGGAVGATLMHVSLDEAQRLFGADGTTDSIPIRLVDGADPAAVGAAIAELLPGGTAEVVDNATITAEQEAEFNEGITIVGNVLLGFAIVSFPE